MLITATTNAGVNNTIDPSVAATFSWTTSPAQAAYEFKWREVGTIIWTGTGKVISTNTSYTVPANSFTKNRHIEWSVRAWDSSQAVSAWYGMDVIIAEAETKHIINVDDIQLKAVSFGKSKNSSKMKFKDPDSNTYELDVVSIDDYAASAVRISQDGVTIQALAKKLGDYDAAVYSDHINTGNILYADQSGYSAYSNWSNGGYNNWCNGGYSRYNNWCNSGSCVYGNWCNGGYSRYNNTAYKVKAGSYYVNYSQYNAGYSNWCNGGYSRYCNYCASGESGYSDWCNGGYNNWSNGGYSAYSNLSGYAAYSNHSDSFSRSY